MGCVQMLVLLLLDFETLSDTLSNVNVTHVFNVLALLNWLLPVRPPTREGWALLARLCLSKLPMLLLISFSWLWVAALVRHVYGLGVVVVAEDLLELALELLLLALLLDLCFCHCGIVKRRTSHLWVRRS